MNSFQLGLFKYTVNSVISKKKINESISRRLFQHLLHYYKYSPVLHQKQKSKLMLRCIKVFSERTHAYNLLLALNGKWFKTGPQTNEINC
jgi:DNA-binding transcriptional regulator WhiA